MKRKKERESQKDMFRRLGIPEKDVKWMSRATLRYKNPMQKGVYWYFVSRLVRMRDFVRYGTCISCGRKTSFDQMDAGHFVPAGEGSKYLLFDPTNVNGECKTCNGFDGMHLLGYAKGLDERYGEGTAANLKLLKEKYKGKTIKDWTAKEYEDLINQILPAYQAAKEQLENTQK